MLSDCGEGGAEGQHALIFCLVAGFTPAGMIAGLLSAFGIAPGGLHVSPGVGADPDGFPCRRNDERLDSSEGFGVP